MKYTVSIVICTRDRPKLLDRCLRSLAATDLAELDAEVIVVDNGSRDHTETIVNHFVERLQCLRYLVEPRPGIAYARNLGWKAAQNDIVLYLDDDVVVVPGAIGGVSLAYEQWWDGSSPICVGGRVVPEFVGCAGYPTWLHDAYKPFLTQLDLGGCTRWLHKGERLVGASFSVPRSILNKLGGFNERLAQYGYDERWLEHLVILNGGRLLYCGTSTVQHAVTPERLRIAWFIRRLYLEGESYVLMAVVYENMRPRQRWALGAREVLRAVSSAARLAVALLLGRAPHALDAACRLANAAGSIRGLLISGTGTQG